MTDREKAIVSAYTGIAMLTGDKFSIFHKYVEDILGRSVWTHELADRAIWEEIREKSKADFLALCAESTERPQGEWITTRTMIHDGNPYCSICDEENIIRSNFCPNCGADLRKPNCVTCDHFGECDGCEKGEEE